MEPGGVTVMVWLRVPKHMSEEQIMERIRALEGVEVVEEL